MVFLAAFAIFASAANPKGSHKSHKKLKSPPKPSKQNHKTKANQFDNVFNNIPGGLDSLLDDIEMSLGNGATGSQPNGGKRDSSAIKQQVQDILSSPGMAAMQNDLAQQRAGGASYDQLIDSAFDAMVGKRDAKAKAQGAPVKTCAESCVEKKQQQCFFVKDVKLSAKDCKTSKVRSDCRKSCDKQ